MPRKLRVSKENTVVVGDATPPRGRLNGALRSGRRGALLGLFVGDALGVPFEFSLRNNIPKLPQRLRGPIKEMRGGGPFKLLPGQVTDDSHMAICLATALAGRDELPQWEYEQWARASFDVGRLTRTSLRRMADYGRDAGERVWREQNKKPAGNGSLMRTTPIALYCEDDRKRRRELSLLDSALTHFDPHCQIACAAFNAAVWEAIRWSNAFDAWTAARQEVHDAAWWLLGAYPELGKEIEQAKQNLLVDLDLAAHHDPRLYELPVHLYENEGFVRVAFRLAFWELLHSETFEEALVDVVNRGGDSDTNGAITGALLGALHGDGGIPEAWSNAVLSCSPPEPFASTYHPLSGLLAFNLESP